MRRSEERVTLVYALLGEEGRSGRCGLGLRTVINKTRAQVNEKEDGRGGSREGGGGGVGGGGEDVQTREVRGRENKTRTGVLGGCVQGVRGTGGEERRGGGWWSRRDPEGLEISVTGTQRGDV